MDSVKHLKRVGSAIARKADGNPEGKGLNGFLLDWYQSEPTGVIAKPRRQLLAEFFTSMLVLSAAFKYRPAVGTVNYLYWINNEWSLSLIAPAEWSTERQAAFAGTCVLQRDMTWTITPSDAFAEMLNTDLTLEEILPFYVRRLPYYQRLFASALSRSMRTAVTLGDQASNSCRQWRTLLPQRKDALLSYTG
jgi:hypothetical protein